MRGDVPVLPCIPWAREKPQREFEHFGEGAVGLVGSGEFLAWDKLYATVPCDRWSVFGLPRGLQVFQVSYCWCFVGHVVGGAAKFSKELAGGF